MNIMKSAIWPMTIILGLFLIWASSPESTTQTSAPITTQVGLNEDVASQIELVPIEEIRVGMRVPARNPEVTDEERARFVDPDPVTSRFIKLELQKADGGLLEIEMIRSLDWIEEHEARPGRTIYLEMEELGAVGDAQVLMIADCPPIADGPGQVVISTFAHPASHKILDVTIEGESPGSSETIGVTSSHPFWSVEHQMFVPVGQFETGKIVKSIDGQSKQITCILPRPGVPVRVYNFEVNGEHVYFVSRARLLVHNNCPRSLNGNTFEHLDNVEVNSGRRFMQQEGIELFEGPVGQLDYLDGSGWTYDLVGAPGASRHWQNGAREGMFNQISKHLNQKSADFVIIDRSHFTASQLSEIDSFVKTLSRHEQISLIFLNL